MKGRLLPLTGLVVLALTLTQCTSTPPARPPLGPDEFRLTIHPQADGSSLVECEGTWAICAELLHRMRQEAPVGTQSQRDVPARLQPAVAWRETTYGTHGTLHRWEDQSYILLALTASGPRFACSADRSAVCARLTRCSGRQAEPDCGGI